jgi:ABC1 atypical kinase-like domain
MLFSYSYAHSVLITTAILRPYYTTTTIMLLQVHKATLLSSGEVVAVKVQYPGAERVMMSDLTNLKALAAFLQKFELNFDILSR